MNEGLLERLVVFGLVKVVWAVDLRSASFTQLANHFLHALSGRLARDTYSVVTQDPARDLTSFLTEKQVAATLLDKLSTKLLDRLACQLQADRLKASDGGTILRGDLRSLSGRVAVRDEIGVEVARFQVEAGSKRCNACGDGCDNRSSRARDSACCVACG